MKYLNRYLFPITLLVLAGFLYYFHNKQGKEIAALTKALDSTEQELYKIREIQATNEGKVKEIVDAITLNKYSGLSRSKRHPFGYPNYCMYSILMDSVVMNITINTEKREIIASSFKARAVEEVIMCKENVQPTAAHTHSYNMTAATFKDNIIEIRYSPHDNNMPQNNTMFKGTLSDDKIIGVITWERQKRQDTPAAYNYSLSCDIVLEKH
jgi:hypothetical protein